MGLIYLFFNVFKEKTKVDSTKGRYPEINNRVWGTETGKYITHQKWNCPIGTTVMFLFMIFSLFTLLILFSLSSFVALSPPNIQDFANMLRSVPVTHEYNHS